MLNFACPSLRTNFRTQGEKLLFSDPKTIRLAPPTAVTFTVSSKESLLFNGIMVKESSGTSQQEAQRSKFVISRNSCPVVRDRPHIFRAFFLYVFKALAIVPDSCSGRAAKLDLQHPPAAIVQTTCLQRFLVVLLQRLVPHTQGGRLVNTFSCVLSTKLFLF